MLSLYSFTTPHMHIAFFIIIFPRQSPPSLPYLIRSRSPQGNNENRAILKPTSDRHSSLSLHNLFYSFSFPFLFALFLPPIPFPGLCLLPLSYSISRPPSHLFLFLYFHLYNFHSVLLSSLASFLPLYHSLHHPSSLSLHSLSNPPSLLLQFLSIPFHSFPFFPVLRPPLLFPSPRTLPSPSPSSKTILFKCLCITHSNIIKGEQKGE